MTQDNNNNDKNQKYIDYLLNIYFNQPNILYDHLFSSYHQFINEIIPYSLINENNIFYENVEGNVIYLHGFKCSNIRIKLATFENDNKILFPSDARRNHLNYFTAIIADIYQYVEKVDLKTDEKTINIINEIEKDIQIGNVPIMIKSKYCSTTIKQDLKGECKYDPGGYFIVNGQEKVVLSMEKMVDNKILIFKKKDLSYEDGWIYTAQINSKKNDWSDNLQILTIKTKKDGVFTVSTSSQLVDIPLFILMRALGVESDKDIISHITYNLEDTKMLNLLRSSINNSYDDKNNIIRTKSEAIEFLITRLKRNKRISQTDEEIAKIQKKMLLNKILRQDLLPHLGEDINKKIVFLSLMTNKLINVILGLLEVDDRDALQNKRIETPGILLGQLFRQNWKKMLSEIGKNFKKKNQSDEHPIIVIGQIKSSIIEQGIKTALSTGFWGMNIKKIGVAQSLLRQSWNHAISYLRRILSPSMDPATEKLTSIRQVNSNQINLLCCVETPEGKKIGVVKSLAMMGSITIQNLSQNDVINTIFNNNKNIKHPYDINPLTMKQYTKLFVNGNWIGVIKIEDSYNFYNILKKYKRENIIDKTTTILFNYDIKEIKIYYDGGRLYRPLLIVNDNKLNLNKEIIQDIIDENNLNDKTKSWKKIISKYPNLIEYEDIETLNFLLVAENENKLIDNIKLSQNKVINTDSTKINRYGDYRWVKYTHCEFHAWVMLGTIVANIPFSNHNYGGRNILHFAQSKQSMGIYLSSYKDRMDNSHILYHPQIPLVTTKAMDYNCAKDLPYGENAIVAIMSYDGYNQEDSIIMNQSAIDRGLFRADTLRKYGSGISKNPSTSQDDIFIKPEKNKVIGMKGNYDKLNEKGYAPEETIIENEDVIIGKISPIQPTGNNNKVYKDNSVIYKNNIQGVVDRVHTGIIDSDGYEMYNMTVRIERTPMIGDKFTNFHGAKGTIGMIYPQCDMPFTESGIVPDLILNPIGYTKRMAIGQFIESFVAKESAINGHFSDGTPFNDYDVNDTIEKLEKAGYNKYGTEIMYCGLTGKKMKADIFIGPLYNIRIKHLVDDKVHGRAEGPIQALNRQPLEGRSRDGGLKIGEMERDAMIAHGMGQFIKERLMESSDIYKIHVCDDCGMFAAKVPDKEYYRCKGCNNSTRISAVVLPYACKLLFQELMAVNILPRIRTERNIYSDEI